ncbi:MAG: signal peptide peptidase SppA [Bacteroidales bacterium]|nr:signal peptide peptidase SppA [Bacteroidales bacterium]MDD2204846.1 signal peptide peptidase SppA [Bacteroidales bacterium]MDD3914328.1 signal peptide peptidase SppA [Bacteroidales bacterium]MDD4634123.1 signal peptide peptidase SppA [Bacteroidales bacterium]
MKNFFKYVLATIVGLILTGIIVSIFLGAMISSISLSSNKEVIVKPNSVLHLNFDKQIYDKAPSNLMSSFNPMNMEMESYLGLNTIIECIEKAKTDDNIKGIFIETLGVSGGIAIADEIRQALSDFKESGKFIVTYSKNLTQTGYYLASISDKIFINPEGSIAFTGLSAEVMFYKDMLDKLDVDVSVFRPVGNKFKSAVEPFINNKMSEANKEQVTRYLTSIWGNMLKEISTSRNISIEALNKLADDYAIKSSEDAMDNNLIDSVAHYDEALAYINMLLGKDKDATIENIRLSSYSKVKDSKSKEFTKDRIAVIYAQGNIIDGKGDELKIGDQTLAKQIRDARKNNNIKAIVFRVNSPGGSALASEVILREILLAKHVKPVIASYGTYAASGGYYISCCCDKIVSGKNTLTGSIGVFGMLPDMHKLLNEKIGITTDYVGTNKNSRQLSPFSPMTEDSKEYMNTMVNDIYKTFIGHVADGRSMTTEAVDNIGQGRVWTGTDALEIGLVDEIGGLNRAIEVAAEAAGITNYVIENYPKDKDTYTQLMEMFSGETPESKMSSQLGILYPYYQMMTDFTELNNVQARLPYRINIY